MKEKVKQADNKLDGIKIMSIIDKHFQKQFKEFKKSIDSKNAELLKKITKSAQKSL